MSLYDGFKDIDGYYKDKCGMCESYPIWDKSKATPRGYVCPVHSTGWFSTVGVAFDDSCNHQRNDRRRKHKDIKDAYEVLIKKCGRYNPKSYNYYIATVVDNILKTDVTKIYWQMISEFRENILEKNIQYFNLLVSYDIYGRIIAYAIEKDENKKEVALAIYNNYLIPICNLISIANYDTSKIEEVIFLYKQMVENLMDLYKIPNIKEYDYNNLTSLSKDDITRIRRF